MFFSRFKNGPFSPKAKKQNLMEPKTKQFHHKKYELQFDTSTSIILGSRLFKARGYNLRSYTIYSTTAVSSRVHSSSTGITHLRGLTRHTSTDAAYTDRRSGRVQAHSHPALSQEPSLRRTGGKMRWMCAIDRQEELWANDELSLGSSLYTPTSKHIYSTAVCCCEAVLLSRHDSLDSPSTLGIWLRSGRTLGVERAARAEAARADGRCWGGSTLPLL